MEKGPILIVCSASSGSTLLSNILDKHPEIAIGPELYILNKDKVYRNFKELKKKLPGYLKNGLATKGQIKPKNFFFNKEAYYLSDQIIKDFIIESNGLKDFFDRIFNHYLAKRNKEIWGEKTGSNAYYLDKFIQIYTNTKIIHLVRDPYDSVRSIKKRGSSSINAISHYLYNNIAALRFQNLSNYYRIKYEDLVNNPENELKKLCKHLDVDFYPEILTSENKYWKNTVNLSDNTHLTWNNQATSNIISTSSIGKGKKSFVDSDHYIMSKISLSNYAKKLLHLDKNKTYDFNYLLHELGYKFDSSYKQRYPLYLRRELFKIYIDKLQHIFRNRIIFMKPLFSIKR